MYSRSITEVSKSTLMDIILDLEEYKDHLVLGGGWATHFVLNKFGMVNDHQGSVDMDFVVEPLIIKSEVYDKIISVLMRKGFKPYVTLPYRFYREVFSPYGSRPHVMKIDFITDPLFMKRSNASKFIVGKMGAGAVVIRGMSVVLQNNFEHRIRGILPSGVEDSVKFKVADLVGCLTSKALAIKGRRKEKDLHDFMNLLKCHPKGLDAVPPEMGIINDNILILKHRIGLRVH